jgi:hypothetical protein
LKATLIFQKIPPCTSTFYNYRGRKKLEKTGDMLHYNLTKKEDSPLFKIGRSSMKKSGFKCAAVVATAIMLAGCGTPGSNQERASTAGALVGAGVGTVVGAALRHPVEGAVAGALIGGGTGSLVGQQQDQQAATVAQTRRTQAAQARVAANPPVGKDDVIALIKAEVSEDIVMNKIGLASYVTPLSTQDIIDMKKAGVSDKIINAMLTKMRDQATAATVDAGSSTTETTVRYYTEPWPWWPFWAWPPVAAPGPAPVIGPWPHPRP